MTATATATKPGALIVRRDRHYRECPECKGEGAVDVLANDPQWDDRARCMECAGTGTVEEWRDMIAGLSGVRAFGLRRRPFGPAMGDWRKEYLSIVMRPTLAALVQAERRIAA